jgi:hypothetical protein
MRIRIPAIIIATAATSILAVACYDKKNPTAPSSGDSVELVGQQAAALRLQSVTVSPAADTIGVGQTVQLTATANPPTSVVFVWKSSRTSTATVDQNGLVTGVSVGRITITAKAGGKTGKSTITVTAAPPPPPPPPPPPGSEVFVGAGDIAGCSTSGDEATANVLDNIPGTVFTLGDNVYDSGSTTEYNNCYAPQTTWGRHKARTRPSPGNHDYVTAGAAGYFGYFGAAAGDPAKGYYSYDLGDWHIIALNSNITRAAGSAQEVWLRADLAANAKSCTLAYWHHPRFSSGFEHGNDTSVEPFWQALYDYNADVVLSGHDHDYERFAPQTPTGVADAARGIREFIVGTGGRSHYSIGTLKANSQVFDATSYGVLKLTLYNGGYDWEFAHVAGATFTDAGSGVCH